LQSLPIEGEPLLLAPEIIRYVARTHENVVLDDASQQGAFTGSSYVQEQSLKSVLCTPLISRGALLGLVYLENNLAVGAFTPERVELLRLLGTQASISITNARALRLRLLNAQLEAENARMEAELDVTRRLQLMLLPGAEELAQVEGLDIAGFMEPADEVGGDYYDVLQHQGQVKLGIGDVTGHGLESGVVMLMLQTAVRALLISGERDPVRFMDVLNRTLHANMQRIKVGKNLTLALLDYDGAGKLRLSGQHEHLIIVRQGGQVERVDTLDLGFPLGLEPEITRFVAEIPINLQPGDGIVLYSDGITEAENGDKEFYSLERLCEVVSAHWAGTVEAIKDAVIADARAFIGEQTVYDDLTLLVVKQR
jgi:serine phosphatase RsbU (regulator of sigma subunit)